MPGFDKEYKDGYSIVWDENGKFREQTWPELRDRINRTQGGIGVIADDFIEMLRYRPTPFRDQTQTLRNNFADLIRDATTYEDLGVLAHILNYMLRDPWATNIDGAWFVYYIEEKYGRDIDLARASAVVNLLHKRNRYAASVLCQTLGTFVYGKDKELVIDQLINSGKLSGDVIEMLKGITLPPPRTGKRELVALPQLFLSYSRSDFLLMRKVRSLFSAEGLDVWTDEMLEPGTAEWQSAIERAIKTCGALVVILTQASFKSVWIRREIDYASAHKKKIFPILAEGDEGTSIPIDLINTQRIDIRHGNYSGMTSLVMAARRYLIRYRRGEVGVE